MWQVEPVPPTRPVVTMNKQYAVYTAETNCQDCCRCLRSCPVKAIRVEKGRAAIVPELCVACGTCVDACPGGAKKIRSDIGRVRALLARRERVLVSVAPSYAAEFPEVRPGAFAAAMKELGFAGTAETAIGADRVTHALADLLGDPPQPLSLSTACPAAVDFIRKYMPEFAPCLTPLGSPMVAHSDILRKEHNESIGVVFIGPCIAKKVEADADPLNPEAALTFGELRQFMKEEGVSFRDTPGMDDSALQSGRSGAVYPVAGGMIEALRELGACQDVDCVAVCGIDSIWHTLKGLDPSRMDRPVFLEMLACEGGCINGPSSDKKRARLLQEQAIRRRHRSLLLQGAPAPVDADPVPIGQSFSPAVPLSVVADEQSLRIALERVGKYVWEDELNCGGCGYDTCREFAASMLEGRAEPDMCLSFLRKKAQRKANALLRCMPSGVVIADANLQVVECNRNFAAMIGSDTMMVYDARPGLEGANLERLVPFADLFRRVLATDEDYRCDMMRVGDRLLNVTLFPIEPHQTVGGIVLDVTRSELRREYIAQRAREVIDRNMATVQEIACKLGEHMADTEILLRNIAEDYGERGRSEDE